MNVTKIDRAVSEAKRFIEAAERAKARLEADGFAGMGSKETGACRRASLDLTRSLAELRK